MTVEESVLVAIPRTDLVTELLRDIVSAAQRAEKADPGDRSDVVRYEALCVRLEAHAEQALLHGAQHVAVPSPLGSAPGFSFEDQAIADDARLSARLPGDLAKKVIGWARAATVVELRRGLEPGPTPLSSEVFSVPEPAVPWLAEGDVTGSRAAEQRFRAQFQSVIDGADERARNRGDSINPSGVNNRIITQTLRQFVHGDPQMRVDAPIVYKDGSTASHPFPLRCLPLAGALPSKVPDMELHLALLSIRHTEMDPVVDGAWLRNAEVSRPRPAALTDDFVYETSRTQFLTLTEEGTRSVVLHVYQTGLDTAVVGFYRAVVNHMLELPGSLSVVPMFFASANRSTASGEAPFRPGQPWTTGAHGD